MRIILAVALTWATSQAHYTYDKLIVNGQATGPWEYVRMTENHYSNAPVQDVTSLAMRCYAINSSVASTTKTMAVKAGDTVGFTSTPATYHAGPLSFYLARAPDGTPVNEWDGDGPVWFKIFEDAPLITPSSISWPNTNKDRFTVQIPACLEDGEYLLRIEQVGLHSASVEGAAQFYISCAQLSVSGGGESLPDETESVEIPGALKASDPGLVINIYYPIPQTYHVPGPEPWRCPAVVA